MIELVLSRPLVTTGMIQATLKVSRQGALDLVAAFGLREMTGRGRYKGWGIVYPASRLLARVATICVRA